MKKRILAMLLAGVLALSLVACGDKTDDTPKTSDDKPGTSQPAENEGPNTIIGDTEIVESDFDGVKEVIVGISADIKTWEPWGGFNLARQNEAPLVYQNLTVDVVDLENNTMQHCFVLAESAEKIGDLTYQIKIREGIKDSAGHPFTAEDAIFSFEKCAEVSSLSQVRIIESMELVDELTFNMNVTHDTVGTFYDVCNAINMVTKESYEASPDGMVAQPVGTGPMILTEYVAGATAVFEKNENYWNNAANESKSVEDGYCTMFDFTNIDKVTYECITDSATMAIALESGEIDIARAIGTEDVELFKSNDAFKLFSAPDAGLGVAFNVSSESPLENYNLRMALAYAISAENALEAAVDGYGTIAKAWSYPTFVDYQKAWDSRDYFPTDMAKAKEYLAKWEQETGKKASDLALTILLQNEDTTNALALSVQADVGQLTGNPNTVTISALDRGTFNTAKKDPTAFDIYVVDSQLVTRSHSGFEWDSLVNQAKNKYNCFFAEDDVLQEKLMAAIENKTTSAETVTAFEQYIMDQAYMKNLIYADGYGACASWIGNTLHATGAKNCLNLGALSYDWANSGK